MGNVLITGGAGFIGSHTADILERIDKNIIIIDNYSNINSGYRQKKATYLNVDILSNDLDKIFIKYKIDYCIHFAANVSVNTSNENPIFDATQNILGSINILQLCKKYNVKKFIAASSAAVYGNPEYLPIDENHRTQTLSCYGLSKLTMEKYIQLSGLNYIIFRFSNVYGERQTTHGEAGVVSIFNNLMRQNQPIFIDGDGEQTRDFIYVTDVANIVVKGLTSSITNEIINVSTNSAISINTLFNTMAKYYGYSRRPIYRKAREGDIKHSILNNEKLIKLFGDYSFINIEDGLRKLKES